MLIFSSRLFRLNAEKCSGNWGWSRVNFLRSQINGLIIPQSSRNCSKYSEKRISCNLPSLAFKLFPAFAKTWLSTWNRWNSKSISFPHLGAWKWPQFEGHEIEASLVINISTYQHIYIQHISNDSGFEHRQPRLVTYAAWISLLWSLVALQQ